MNASPANSSNARQHPYFPSGVKLPEFTANTIPPLLLVGYFASGVAIICLMTYIIASHARPNITNSKLATTMWFVVCAFIHFFFEGYFVYHFKEMPGRNDLFGQLWKEYSLSDSRYMIKDPFTVCMEAVTAVFWGPLSLAIACCIVVDHPLQHPLQIIVSLGQLYGNIIYLATSTFNDTVFGIVFYRPEWYYFYMYFVFCNAFWIIIPLMVLFRSVVETAKVFANIEATKTAAKKDL